MKKLLIAFFVLAFAVPAWTQTQEQRGFGLTNWLNKESGTAIHIVTITYLTFKAAGGAGSLTSDVTVVTLPAKTKIIGFYTDTTIAYAGTGITDADLTVGKSAGGVEYIAIHDVFAGAVTKGLADADMGTELVRAAAIQGGALVNWTAAIAVSARLTTTIHHSDDLTAGSTTFYVVTERY